MSSVDQRVVEMRFDNHQFESGVQQSMSTIDRLKQALNFGGAVQGLDNLGKAAAKLSPLGGMSNTLSQVTNGFSVMGAIGFSAINNLTNSAINFGKRMISSVINPLTQGGINRALNIESAKFQLEGLGVAWEDISDDINYGVKDTAYGLDVAAKAASQLVASGVELGDSMKTALRGISGTAAMTNSSFEEISPIFTTVAGQGKLMTMQLRQLENRGLNAAAAIGKELGKTEEQVRDMVTHGQIDFETFASAMDSAFGEHAKEANKTFTGALSNMKAALSRIGADVVQVQLVNLRDIFNSFKDVFDSLHVALNPTIKDFNAWTEGISKQVTTILQNEKMWMLLTNTVASARNIFNAFLQVITPIKTALLGIFPGTSINTLNKFISRFRTATAMFKLDGDTYMNLYKTFSGLFSVIKMVTQAIYALWVVTEPVRTLFVDLIKNVLGFTGSIGQSITEFERYATSTNYFVEKFTYIRDVIGRVLGYIWSKTKNFRKSISDIIVAIKEFFATHFNLSNFDSVGEALDAFLDKVHPIKLLSDAVKGLFGSLISMVKSASPLLSNLLNTVGLIITNTLKAIGQGFASGKGFETILNAFNTATLIGISKAFSDFMKTMLNSFKAVSSAGTVIANVKGVLIEMKKTLKALQTELNAKALKELAIAIAILAVSLIALSGVEQSKMLGAIGAITALFAELTGSFSAFLKISGDIDGRKMVTASTGMIMMSVAIGILASAVKKVASAGDVDSITDGLISVLVLIWNVVAVSEVLSKSNGDLKSSVSGLLGMSAAVYILAAAVKNLSKVDSNAMWQGVAGITAIIAVMGGLIIALDKFEENQGNLSMKQGFALIEVAAAINLVVMAIKSLGRDLNVDEFSQGLLGLTLILAEIGALMISVSNFGGDFSVGSGLAILELAVSIRIVASAMAEIGKLDQNGIKQAIVSMIIIWVMFESLALTIGNFSKLMSGSANLIEAAGSLLIISVAMAIVASAMADLGKIDGDNFHQAIFGLFMIFAALEGFAFTLQYVDSSKLLGIAATMIVFSIAIASIAQSITVMGALSATGFVKGIFGLTAVMVGIVAFMYAMQNIPSSAGVAGVMILMAIAINILAKSLSTLSNMSISQMVVSLLALAGVFTIIGIAAVALSEVIIPILTFAGAIALIGVSIAAVGVGIFAFAAALPTLGQGIVDLCTTFVTNFGIIDEAIGKMFVLLLKYIPSLVQVSMTYITALCVGILEMLRTLIPEVVDVFITLVDSILQTISEHIYEITDSALKIVVGFVEAISNNLGMVIQAGIDLIIAYINGLADGIRNNHEAFYAAAWNLVMALLEAIVGYYIFVGNKAGEFTLTFIEGLKSKFGEFGNAAKEFVFALRDRLLERVDAFKEAAKYFVLGFANGLKEYASLAVQPVKDFAKSILTTFNIGLDERSPSKETEQSGKFFDEGFENGVTKSAPGVLDIVAGFAKDIVGTFNKNTYDQPLNWSDNLDEYTTATKKAAKAPAEEIEENNEKIAESSTKATKAVKEESETLEESGGIWEYAQNVIDAFYKRYSSHSGEIDQQTLEIQASQNAVQNFAEIVWRSSDVAEKAAQKEEEAIRNGKKSERNILEEMQEAWSNYTKNIRDAVSKSIDIFSKFEKKTEMSSQTLIENMRSQVEGVQEYYNNIMRLNDKGILSRDFTEKLIDMGAKSGYEIVNAMINASDSELEQMASLYEQSLSLPDDLTNELVSSMAYTAQMFNQGFTDGIDPHAADEVAREMGENSVAALNEGAGVASPSWKTEETGFYEMEGNRLGLRRGEPLVLKTISDITKTMIQYFRESLSRTKFRQIGYLMMVGLADGIKAGKSMVINAAVDAAVSAYRAACEALDIQSPSRKMYEVGRFFDEGFGNGISKFSYGVVQKAKTLATDTLGAFQEEVSGSRINLDDGFSFSEGTIRSLNDALSSLRTLVTDSLDTDPVIRPVLDLSNVEAGAQKINQLFANRRVKANVDESQTTDAKNQNGGSTFNFTQNNYSPKALSREEIYRQTRSQFSALKGLVNAT